jgi:hypothetical protein
MTVRHLMWASLVTGLIAVVWYVNSLSDPAYYDPETIADYAASVLAEIFFLSAAYTLAVWWRVTPVRQSALFILGAAVGFALWSVGNVLEEIMGIDLGEGIYFVGAGLAGVLTAIGGVVTLTAPTRWRWSGVVLLAIPASFLLEDVLTTAVAAIPWLGFAYVLWRGMLDVPSDASPHPTT